MSLQNSIIKSLVENLNTDKEVFDFVRSIDAALRLLKGATINTHVTLLQPKQQQKEIIKETPKPFNKKQYIKKEKPSYPINPKSSVPYAVETASIGSTNIVSPIEIPSDLGMYIDFSIKDSQAIKPVQQN